MPRSPFCVAAFLCVTTLPFSLPAHSQTSNTVMRGNSLRVETDMVLVPVTVSDGMDRPVMGLDKKNFALYEDDQQQEIRYFSMEDAPISVALLLDLSRSMSDKFLSEQAAVSEFFKNANSRDDYVLIHFRTALSLSPTRLSRSM